MKTMNKLTRRDLLKSAGSIGGVLIGANLPIWALANVLPRASAPQSFVNASSVLLGIDPQLLNPGSSQDDLPLSDVFFDLIRYAGGDAGVAHFIVAYDELVRAGWSPSQIAQRLLSVDARPRVDAAGTFARLTILMWLYGTWYGGTEIRNVPASSASIVDSDYRKDFVVSGRAYKNGWVWRIAQTHPMGFSQFSFGSWADLPPSLADYGIKLGAIK